MTFIWIPFVAFAYNEFLDEARNPNPEKIKKMLATGKYDNKLNSALGAAARWSTLEMVKTLVEAGADNLNGALLAVADRSAETAAEAVEISAYLLDKGADVDVKATVHSDGYVTATPLYKTCDNNERLALWLLAHGADPELLVHIKGRYALTTAIGNHYFKLASELIKRGVPPLREGDGELALNEAAGFGAVDVIYALLDAGVDVNALDAYGRNALYDATIASTNSVLVFDILVASGADITICDKRGFTLPVHARRELKHLRSYHKQGFRVVKFEYYQREILKVIERIEQYLKEEENGRSPAELARKYLEKESAEKNKNAERPHNLDTIPAGESGKRGVLKEKNAQINSGTPHPKSGEPAAEPGKSMLMWLFALAVVTIGAAAIIMKRKR
jgi:ankyrin repeat protein